MRNAVESSAVCENLRYRDSRGHRSEGEGLSRLLLDAPVHMRLSEFPASAKRGGHGTMKQSSCVHGRGRTSMGYCHLAAPGFWSTLLWVLLNRYIRPCDRSPVIVCDIVPGAYLACFNHLLERLSRLEKRQVSWIKYTRVNTGMERQFCGNARAVAG